MKVGAVDTYRAAQLRLQEVLLAKRAEEQARAEEVMRKALPPPTVDPDRQKGLKIDVKV